MSSTKYEIATICDEIKNMLIEKNLRYGDSALNPTRIMSKADSVEQIKVRIDDKLSRLSRGNLDDDNEDVINDLIGYFILLKIARQRENISNEETDYDYSELSFRSNDNISTGSLTSDVDNYNSFLYTDSHRPIHFPV